MCKEKRQPRASWTYKHYKEYQRLRLNAALLEAKSELAADEVAKAASTKMNAGEDNWHEGLKNYDKLTAPKKNEAGKYKFKDVEFLNYQQDKLAQGYVEEYWQEQRCFSGMINNPGVSLLPAWLMGPAHFIFLGYLFLGI